MSTTTNDAVITTTSDREVHIERDFDAPLERVWNAYSRIEQLSRWWGRGHIDTTTFVDLGDGRTRVVTDSIFHTADECVGMLGSGMEVGLNDSYRALDALLAAGN